MSSILIRMEAFAGSSIEAVAEEMMAFANQTSVTAMLNFNGVNLMAVPGDSAELLVAGFHKELGSKRDYKLARGRPVVKTVTTAPGAQ